jgi:hypothetical protein
MREPSRGRRQEEGSVNTPGIDPRLLHVLSLASSLELLQLNSVIERMLSDPERIVQVRRTCTCVTRRP